MRTTAKLMVWVFFAVSLASGALAADPTISDVVARQRWPWSQLVDVDYVLTCDATQSVDVAVTAKDGSTTLTLPSESLSGDLNGVSTGLRRIVWDPTKTAYTNRQMLTQFSVTLTPTEAPLYMIVDLTKSAGADGQVEYIYPGDARLVTYGRFTNVWFGVTNDSAYATTKLVLRRVHAGTFGMGDSANISTTLTKDFYAGAFKVTQRQWELITGTKPSFFNNATCYASRPVEQVSYNNIRGAMNDNPVVNWPATDRTVVSTNSFLGKLRAKTGLMTFDLPTEAQWEYMCRAGTTTYYSDGLGTPGNTTSNAQLNVLGRYKYNGGLYSSGAWPSPSCGLTSGSATVGSYLPNNWGIYDTHGNVCEWCLDWYDNSVTGGLDPSGPVSKTTRILRSGSFGDDAATCRSAFRYPYSPNSCYCNIGFRIVLTLP